MADYWVQTNEDMNPIRVTGLSDAEAEGILKLLKALAAEGELVFLRDCRTEEDVYENYDEWSARRRSVNSSRSIKASEDKITYVAFYNEDILGNYDNYDEAVADLKAEIDEMIAKGRASWVDFERCWIEDEADEEVMYCADSDDDYADYV